MHKSNYDKYPFIQIDGYESETFNGYKEIIAEVRHSINASSRKRHIVAIDCYPGVRDNEILSAFQEGLGPVKTCNTLDIKHSEEVVHNLIKRNLTNDRVFGVLSCHTLGEFFDPDKITAADSEIDKIENGIVLVYGVGAALVTIPDILIYADMPRWEIQQRYRSRELGNWGCNNHDEDFLHKYKRGFFVEWRIADRHKVSLFNQTDYFLDTTISNKPKMITANALWVGLKKTMQKPFRVVPFFDPAPWGGQWMKEVCNLDRSVDNFGWCFDCVPEENSLYLKYGDVQIEIPSINLVFRHPVELLGDSVHARFGAEFPIRFDFLDTVGGGNLSFQVHPLTEYIQQNFGMHYTQDESYYILDVGENASVFLGLKHGIDPEQMIADIGIAQVDPDRPFKADKYANQFAAQKHDHFLIPAGTTHCSGANTMVLEISATPYIFTFKLWDWGRLGLDGKPRPVHLDHGKNVIQWNRTTNWVESNLVNRIEKVADGDGWIEERTGLHEREFIETRRHWFTGTTQHQTEGTVNVLNLIEGEEAIVESPNKAFEPFVVHYAETFIVPACIGKYTIRPHGPSTGHKCGTIKAYIRK